MARLRGKSGWIALALFAALLLLAVIALLLTNVGKQPPKRAPARARAQVIVGRATRPFREIRAGEGKLPAGSWWIGPPQPQQVLLRDYGVKGAVSVLYLDWRAAARLETGENAEPQIRITTEPRTPAELTAASNALAKISRGLAPSGAGPQALLDANKQTAYLIDASHARLVTVTVSNPARLLGALAALKRLDRRIPE